MLLWEFCIWVSGYIFALCLLCFHACLLFCFFPFVNLNKDGGSCAHDWQRGLPGLLHICNHSHPQNDAYEHHDFILSFDKTGTLRIVLNLQRVIFSYEVLNRLSNSDSSFRFLQTLRTPPWRRPQKTGRNWSGLIRMWKECDGKLVKPFYDNFTGWAMKVRLMLSLSDAFVLESQMPSEWPGKHCSLCGDRSSVFTHWAGSLLGSLALPGVCGVTLHPHSDLCYGSAPA